MSLSLRALSAAHGDVRVLSNVDLHVPTGAVACVLGPSGSGKTTLLRSIAGLHQTAGGQVDLDGKILDDGGRHVPAAERRIGYIPQHVALFPHLNVAANVAFGVPRRRRREVATRLLAMVDLASLADRMPDQLSGGQQQRVAVARALAIEPSLILLDEPFAALDPGMRSQVRAEVMQLLRTYHATAVMVTHDASEALAIADQITVMDHGTIVQSAHPVELYHRPVSIVAARALGEATIVAGVAHGHTVHTTALGDLPISGLHPAGPADVIIRPGQIQLVEPHAEQLTARVVGAEYRGDDLRYTLQVHNLAEAISATHTQHLPVGSLVGLHIHGEVHVVARRDTGSIEPAGIDART